MGRELKRVPLDFDWPLDKVYEGFLNPFWEQRIKCPHCEGGWSAEYTTLHSMWYSHLGGGFRPEMRGSAPYRPEDELVQRIIRAKVNRDRDSRLFYGTDEAGIMREAIRMCEIWNNAWAHHLNELDVAALLKADRLWDFTRVPRTEAQRKLVAKRVATGKHNSWLPRNNGYVPTPKEVNDWSLQGFSHDSSNCYIVLKAELKRLGQPLTCAHCKGESHTWPSTKVKRQYERWRPKQPPKGDGYQIWETVSEGSPISPVFATPEELADWMVANDRSITRDTDRYGWLRFIHGPGLAPTMISNGHQIISGVRAS